MPDLIENKREMFDGMRAYHQSEISHANHAITMLLAIAGAAGTVVLAILFPETPPNHKAEIVWGLWITVTVLALAIAATTHMKVNSDHDVYSKFGREYVKTSKILGFYDKTLSIPGSNEKTSIKTDEKIGQGKGYKQTLRIIWSFAALLILLTLFFAISVCCLA